MQQDFVNNAVSFVLPSLMNIETVEELAVELKQFLSSEKPNLVLDASKVENINTAGLQLIISLEKTLSASGGTLTVQDESEAFANSFKDVGLENLLDGRKHNG